MLNRKFLDRFKTEYDFLYNNKDNVAGYDEAVAEFDKRVREDDRFLTMVKDFNDIRHDFISSDREAAAFIFTLESLGLI